MNKVYIGIATYKRPQKLERLLKSIYSGTYQHFEIYVMFEESDKETIGYFERTKFEHLHLLPSKNKEYVISNWNRFYKEVVPLMDDKDFTLTLVDDVAMFCEGIAKSVNKLVNTYPDGDGVIGLKQMYPNNANVKYHPAGQVLIGKKFLERYKDVDYQVCCPNYIQWLQDEELLKFVTSLDKFTTTDDFALIHYHPAYTPGEGIDETHKIVRGNIIQNDRKIFNKRQIKNLIWGKTWELI
jgi:hypothetical protein